MNIEKIGYQNISAQNQIQSKNSGILKLQSSLPKQNVNADADFVQLTGKKQIIFTGKGSKTLAKFLGKIPETLGKIFKKTNINQTIQTRYHKAAGKLKFHIKCQNEISYEVVSKSRKGIVLAENGFIISEDGTKKLAAKLRYTKDGKNLTENILLDPENGKEIHTYKWKYNKNGEPIEEFFESNTSDWPHKIWLRTPEKTVETTYNN